MQRHTAVLLFILLACPALSTAGIGFQFETAFTPPTLGGDVIATAFTGAAGDLGFQVAVASAQRIIVYNYRSNTVLRTVDYKASRLVGLVFADVTHDRTPDLVYAYTTGGRTPQFVVVGVNGFSGKTDTLRFTGYSGRTLVATGGVIGAFDLNKDGFKELFISADTGAIHSLAEATFGQTRLYYAFPDSLLWKQLTPRILSASYFPWGLTHPGLWLRTQSGYSFPPSHIGPDTTEGNGYLLPDGAMNEILPTFTSPCGTQRLVDWFYDMKFQTYRTSGNYGPGTELFCISNRGYACGDSKDTIFVRTMDMALVHTLSLIEPIWSNSLFLDCEDFMTDPQFDHFFFAFQSSTRTLSMLNISDGTFRSQLTEVPAGEHRWDYPTSDPSPRLIVTNGQEVGLYRLVSTSEQPDDGVNSLLPSNFRLGQTYANPHRFGLVIPLEVPRTGRVTVEIFNRRGKSVRLLADQSMTQGRRELVWDASDAGSGLYDIRATQGNKTVSRRVLLWR